MPTTDDTGTVQFIAAKMAQTIAAGMAHMIWHSRIAADIAQFTPAGILPVDMALTQSRQTSRNSLRRTSRTRFLGTAQFIAADTANSPGW